jgi:hypothetical protein
MHHAITSLPRTAASDIPAIVPTISSTTLQAHTPSALEGHLPPDFAQSGAQSQHTEANTLHELRT